MARADQETIGELTSKWSKVNDSYDLVLEIVCHSLLTLFTKAVPDCETSSPSKMTFKNLEAILFAEAFAVWYQRRSAGHRETYIYGMKKCIDLQVKQWVERGRTTQARSYCKTFAKAVPDLPEGLWPHEIVKSTRTNSRPSLVVEAELLAALGTKIRTKPTVSDIVPLDLIGLTLAQGVELDNLKKMIETKTPYRMNATSLQTFAFSAQHVEDVIVLFESINNEVTEEELNNIGIPNHAFFWTTVVRKHFRSLFAGGVTDQNDKGLLDRDYHLFNHLFWCHGLQETESSACIDIMLPEIKHS